MQGSPATAVTSRPPPPPRRVPPHRAHKPGPRVSVPETKPGAIDRLGTTTLVAIFILLSLGLHVAGGVGASAYAEFAKKFVPPPKEKPIDVAVIEKPPPPPPPPPKVEEPKPEPPKPKPLPLPKPIAKPKVIPPPTDAPPPPPDVKPPDVPPPPNSEAADPTPNPPPIITGISLGSTTTGPSSMAVNVGNTLYGKPSGTAAKPEDVKPYKAEKYAPSYQVSEMPVFLAVLSYDEIQKFYPPEAKKEGIEGDVVLSLVIDDDGSIAEIKVVSEKPAGKGFGEAARKRMQRERFKPAKVNGQPVATTISSFRVLFEQQD